ncbi:hypothetical protein FDP41_010687 [Naegleria fowleri]|uniref:Glycosyltransferase 61 catalytic domain-containing protein n=1 Tax=Naegleria fowleri TaxID=5763 RepID=A0A6A5C9I2_NAEFO|nr:uncharacterized protein FDP41_010687 [Naegleria fowleri]KAF0983622.1 hypothetical protein FDP41_010687 [Naegleria fowleri]
MHERDPFLSNMKWLSVSYLLSSWSSLLKRPRFVVISILVLLIVCCVCYAIVFIHRSSSSLVKCVTWNVIQHQPKLDNQASNRIHSSTDSSNQPSEVLEHVEDRVLSKQQQTSSKQQVLKTRRQRRRQVMFGNFQCNRYTRQTLFTSCQIENVCINTRGQFLLFMSRDRLFGKKQLILDELNRRPWIYTQGRFESNRGLHFMRIIDAELILEFDPQRDSITSTTTTKKDDISDKDDQKNEKVVSAFTIPGSSWSERPLHSISGDPVELDKNFKYYSEPVYVLKRYAAGNMGHFLFDNIAMIVTLMMNFNPLASTRDLDKLLGNHILYLDDVYEQVAHNWIGAYRYNESLADEFSLKLPQLFSKNPPLQLCRQQDSTRIDLLPCRNTPRGTNFPRNNVLQACFANFRIGLTYGLFRAFPSREMIFVQYRQLVYYHLGIYPLPSEENDSHVMAPYLKKKPLKIVIHKKPLSSGHGKIIWNVDELLNAIRDKLQKDPYLSLYHSKQSIQVESLELDLFTMNVTEQVKFFSQVDVYISDQGSAAYYAVYMRKDTSVLIAPECYSDRGCHTGESFQILRALPNTFVVDYLELLRGSEENPNETPCNPRPTAKDLNACDPILRVDVVVENVMAFVKRRFLKMMMVDPDE